MAEMYEKIYILSGSAMDTKAQSPGRAHINYPESEAKED
jgi:hypothetical protein